MTRGRSVAIAVVAALLTVGCSTTTPDVEPSENAQAITELVGELPPLKATDPTFRNDDGCAAAEAHYRYTDRADVAVQTIDEARAILTTRLELLRLAAGATALADVDAVQDALAIYEAFAERANALFDEAGEDTRAVLNREQATLFGYATTEPIVRDGRALTWNPIEAATALQIGYNAMTFGCAIAPDGWERLEDDQRLDLPERSIVALEAGVGWVTVNLATGERAKVLSESFRWLDLAPGGSVFVTTGGQDSTLLFVEPSDWSLLPVTGAGPNWSCPSWSADGSRIIGDADRDPIATASRPHWFTLGGDEDPQEFSDGVGNCPKGFDGDEVVFSTFDSIVAASFTGETRTLWEREDCGLAVISTPHRGRLDVYANCFNPFHNGLYGIDVDTLEVTQHVTGLVGAGDESADGRWRIFSVALDDRYEGGPPVLWLLDQETGRARSLPHEGLTFPLFLPEPD